MGEGAVPVIDLLDDDVDLTPARHAVGSDVGTPTFSTVLDATADSVSELQAAIRHLQQLRTGTADLPRTTIAEQVRAGAITVLQTPKLPLTSGKVPVLTVDDVIDGTGPSGLTQMAPDLVSVEPGDVVVPSGGRALVASVIELGGAVLGPGLYLFRADPERVDPACLAGFLRISGASGPARGQSGTSRADIRRVEIPRLSVAEQRQLGEAFQRLELFERAVARASRQAAELVRAELASGALRTP